MPTKTPAASTGTAKKRKPAAKKTEIMETAQPTQTMEPTQEQIARLAEKYWAERGWPIGSPEQDWLRAERDLKAS